VRYWQGFGNGRLLLLTSDRGYTLAESLIDQPEPLPNLHGSFSLMVNYHAMGEYVSRNGGLVCQVSHYQDNIQLLAYLLGQIPQKGQETQFAFADAVGQGGPDDFHALKSVVEKQYATMNLPELLSFIRMSGWDADVVADCMSHLHELVRQADPAWHADIFQTLYQIEQRYLPLTDVDGLLAHLHNLMELMPSSEM
jgi:hypothetical protein